MTELDRLILLALSEVGYKISGLHEKYKDNNEVRLGLLLATQVLIDYGFKLVPEGAKAIEPPKKPKLRVVT